VVGQSPALPFSPAFIGRIQLPEAAKCDIPTREHRLFSDRAAEGAEK